jgi:hypothetical protein
MRSGSEALLKIIVIMFGDKDKRADSQSDMP